MTWPTRSTPAAGDRPPSPTREAGASGHTSGGSPPRGAQQSHADDVQRALPRRSAPGASVTGSSAMATRAPRDLASFLVSPPINATQARHIANALAERRVEEALASGLSSVDLRRDALRSRSTGIDLPSIDVLPERLRLVNGLELVLDPATLEATMPQLRSHERLVGLTCAGVKRMPSEIGGSLRRLNFDDSPDLELPSTFDGYAGLHQLSLTRCGLDRLPELTPLRELRVLELGGNRLQALPPSIDSLSNLEELRVADNLLQTLPSTLERLTCLRLVDLRNNAIHQVPDGCCQHVSTVRIKSDAEVERFARFAAPIDALDNDQLLVAIRDLDEAVIELEAEWLRQEEPHSDPVWRKVHDPTYLGALVHAENALTPGLEVERIASLDGLRDKFWEMLAHAAAMAPTGESSPVHARLLVETDRDREDSDLEDCVHTLPLDVRASNSPEGPRLSVIGFDSLTSTSLSKALLEHVRELLLADGASSVRFALQPLGIQRTMHGCCIFSLSVAKKMQASEGLLRDLHAAASGEGAASQAPPLPLDYFKHATSATAVEAVRRAIGTEAFEEDIVNGAGQNLRERTNAGRVEVHNPADGTGRVMNVSHMAKRIRFYERACHVYQREALARGLTLDADLRRRDDVPTSSVLPMLAQLAPPSRAGASSAP